MSFPSFGFAQFFAALEATEGFATGRGLTCLVVHLRYTGGMPEKKKGGWWVGWRGIIEGGGGRREGAAGSSPVAFRTHETK